MLEPWTGTSAQEAEEAGMKNKYTVGSNWPTRKSGQQGGGTWSYGCNSLKYLNMSTAINFGQTFMSIRGPVLLTLVIPWPVL